MFKNKNILFFMSGSIAAFKACQVISRLVQEGASVQVIATPSTFQFIGAATLEGLTGKKVLSDIWERGQAMGHIHLTRTADFGVLCPASANTLARMAHGFSDDLVSAMALAWPTGKPFTLIPAMNHQMLAAAITQENLLTLSARGFTVAPTQSGALACGEEGEGRMLEVDEIIRLLKRETLGRVLITGGATREPIDGIRFISNVSTGQTASTLADQLTESGWDVTYLHGVGAIQPTHVQDRLGFESFNDLNTCLRAQLSSGNFSAVIHCAAVSDYSVANPQPNLKLSSADELTLQLKTNFKILPHLKEYSRNKDITVVGFKLTLNGSAEQTLSAAQKTLGPNVDAVVANDWSLVERDRGQHPGSLLTLNGERQDFKSIDVLAQKLHAMFVAKGEPHDSMS